MAEILAPAGSTAAFDAALAAGADAVYLALPKFGARAYAANFTLDQLKETIRQAKILGVKVYVTMNTILYEEEMEDAFRQAEDIYHAGADALIVQDLGLMHLLKHRLPQLEVHASTQVSANRPVHLEKLKKLNVRRTVLARECSLDQIEELCKVPEMETEVFVHGALCISWSGQCQFSAVRHSRSGNRGQCAQACRMEYTLKKNGKPVKTDGRFLLSPKDLSAFQDIPALENAGVASLKIEGRMKSPLYVYEAVTAAREKRRPRPVMAMRLQNAFSRTFTGGHLEQKKGTSLMNMKTSNHVGTLLGKVVRADRDRVTLELVQDLHQEDGIRFVWDGHSEGAHANFIYDQKGKLVSSAKKGETVQVGMKAFVAKGAEVYKTVDAFRTKEVAKAVAAHERRRKVHGVLECKGPGSDLILTLQTDGVQSSSRICEVQKAKRPADLKRMEAQIRKTGDSLLEIDDLVMDVPDSVFVPVGQLNALRRQAVQRLENALASVPQDGSVEYAWQAPDTQPLPPVIAEVNKAGQAVKEVGMPAVFVSEFPFPGTEKKGSIREDEGYVVSHLADGRILAGMNITNSYGIAAALEMGYQGVVMSEEMSEEQLARTASAWKERTGRDVPALVPVYEKRRLMIMDHCPVNTVLKDGQRTSCSLCRQDRYELEGLDGKKEWMFGDAECRMRLFDTEVTDHTGWLPELEKAGYAGGWLTFTDEDADAVTGVLDALAISESH